MATKLNVRVRTPEAAHVAFSGEGEIVVGWGGAKVPTSQVEKNRLKYLLTR